MEFTIVINLSLIIDIEYSETKFMLNETKSKNSNLNWENKESEKDKFLDFLGKFGHQFYIPIQCTINGSNIAF